MNALVPCRLSMQTIIELAAQYFSLTPVEIVSPRKSPILVEARSIAMFAIRELLPRSYPEIGRAFGGRDHTTVMHACRTVMQEILLDDAKRARVDGFLMVCRGATPLTRPDTDPFEAASRIMQRPGLATNVSVETIRAFAAIVSAAIAEASQRDAEAEGLEALRAQFRAAEPAILAFVSAFYALDTASDRGEAHAQRAFQKHAAALVAAFETHFDIKRTRK